MKKSFQYAIILATLTLLPSCATYNLQVRKSHENWPKENLPTQAIDHQIFLIGDAGDSAPNHRTATLQLLKQELETANKNSTVIFLGDNAKFGLPPKNDPNRALAEHQLKAQMDIVKNFPGQVYFLPGNHDWSPDGVDAVRRQADFIEEYLGRDDAFQPNDDGCGGPESESLTDKLGLIILDSQWFLRDWDDDAEMNEECELKTRLDFHTELMDEARDFRGKNLLIVGHHPIYTGGWHGGRHSIKEHLFPTRMLGVLENVPMPVLGSIAIAIKSTIASRQDLNHPLYQDYLDLMEEVARHQGSIIYAGGHDHNLQLQIDNEIVHIVSGGGASKPTPSKLVHDGVMSYGGRGFTILNFYEDGEAWVEFVTPEEEVEQVRIFDNPQEKAESPLVSQKGGRGETRVFDRVIPETMKLTRKTIYRQKIKDALPTTEELTPDVFPEYETGKDSVEVSILKPGEVWDMNNFIWGNLWSDYYYEPIKMPVLDLKDFAGGVTAFKRGGGFQTKSIRLKTDRGPERLYQIRGIQKSADKLFYPLNKTFVKDILEYQYTAANPFAAYLLNPIQDAIGILHTNPQMVYVPEQPKLNRYNDYGGEVFLLEERPDEDWSNLESFGYSKNIESTRNTIEERLEGTDIVIDQSAVARCRLFDFIIGDWDRHEDQWRFATSEIENSDKILYRPIPRDRDQAFAKYEGFVFRLGRLMVPTLRATHPYDDDLKKREVRWMGFNGKHFDRFFLNELEWEDWEKEVKHLQKTLTDEVVDEGMRWLPSGIYEEMGPTLAKAVRNRRDNLMETARTYYEFLNKEVNIPATMGENYIFVERRKDGTTYVRIEEYKDDDHEEKEMVYERTFDNKITQEIRIYGMEGDDVFEVKGKARRSPILRLIGGIDEDKLLDRSAVNGNDRRTKFYDDTVENNRIISIEGEVESKQSNVTEENAFIFRHYEFDYATFAPLIGFNPDDGFVLGLNANIFTHGYRSERHQQIGAKYAFATGGVEVRYKGLFTNAFRRNDFALDAEIELPDYVDNFFGLGNESIRIDSLNRDYYRVSRRRMYLSPSLTNTTQGGFNYSVGPLAEAVKIEQRANTFLANDNLGIRPEVFDYQYFVGAKFKFGYSNIDNIWNPERGIDFQAKTSWRANVEHFDRNYLNLDGALALYLPLSVSRRLIFATKVSGRHNVGDFDFFQANTLGGDDNLRGYASERFSGRTVFYHNNELRWTIINRDNANSIFSFGIAPAIDYGRAWTDGENSNEWHVGYGANVFIAPLDFVAIKAGLMQSDEGSRFTFRLGFDF